MNTDSASKSNSLIQKTIQNTVHDSQAQVVVIGAGLAGSECTWQLAQAGVRVVLIEGRPERSTPAHHTADFAELVCSNSLKSTDSLSAPQQLKWELDALNSLILASAHAHRVAAGQALAVERVGFSRAITKALEDHPAVTIVRCALDSIAPCLEWNVPVVVATGPLTQPEFLESLKPWIGDQLYFYDAIAPIVNAATLDMNVLFRQNRYHKGDGGEINAAEGDYLNSPLNREEYFQFVEALERAEKVAPHEFEKAVYFQGCQPIEALVERGPMTLAFGPMKPKGLVDPRTGQEPFAVVQLRAEDDEGRAFNLVGFQTKLKYGEQQRIFRMLPGLENAEFYRLGSVHRNTYLRSPLLLNEMFELKNRPGLHFAGQISGVEGYLESAAIGALVARQILARIQGIAQHLPLPPATTALGALAHAIIFGKAKNFQPMNINWGLVPLKEIAIKDKNKSEKLVERAQRHFRLWMGADWNKPEQHNSVPASHRQFPDTPPSLNSP